MITDNIFSLQHTPEFVLAFKAMEHAGWEDFLNRWQMREAMLIKSATNEEERAKVQVRTLLIDELRNFSKGLFSLDNAT